MKQQISEKLVDIIDAVGVQTVLEMLSNVCEAQADLFSDNYNDKFLAALA